MRARAEKLLARASEIDTKDAMKAAKAAAKAKEKAEKEAQAAKGDPVKIADSFKVEVNNGAVSITDKDGERLYSLSFGGTRTREFTPDWFDGVFKELDPSLKNSFARQLTDRGMDKEASKKAADLLAKRASEAMFGKIDFEKEVQKPEVQAEIDKAFNDLTKRVTAAEEAEAARKRYSDMPSDDGSYNIEAAIQSRALDDHVKYVNRLRDEISHYEVAMQSGEKVKLNKQTQKWIGDTVYGGALNRAYSKHRDLFVD